MFAANPIKPVLTFKNSTFCPQSFHVIFCGTEMKAGIDPPYRMNDWHL